MKAVILEPQSGWSLSLRSDTLWGLLLIAIRHVVGEGAADEVARAALAGTPLFVVSSAMEYAIVNGQRVLTLPSPLMPQHNTRPHTLAAYRSFKSLYTVSALPYSAWCRLMSGEPDEDTEQPLALSTYFATADILHIAIDRIHMHAIERSTQGDESRGQLYLTTETFAQDAGLWFLVDGDMTLVEPALRYLDHVGFGTDASVGKGHFRVSIEEFSLPAVTEPTHMVTLSLYRPSSAEVSYFASHCDQLWYEIEFRQGKRSAHFGPAGQYLKRRIACFREGSVFPYTHLRSYGTATIVARADDHDVIHNGFALMVPARLAEAS